jgi:hypothetical protein
MKKLWISLVAVVLCWTPAAADDASLPAAQELVDFTLAKTTNDMITKMSEAIWANLQTGLPKTADAAAVTELKGEFDRIIRKYVTDAMKAAPAIYARHFTTDELHQLLAFYKTPLGDKTLTEMPKIMGEFTNSAMLPLMVPMQTEIKGSFDAIMRKHGLL